MKGKGRGEEGKGDYDTKILKWKICERERDLFGGNGEKGTLRRGVGKTAEIRGREREREKGR